MDDTLNKEIDGQYHTDWEVYYDRVNFLRKENHNKNATLINVNIRESLRSLRGVMVLFKDLGDQTKYACNRETFFNLGIEKV